jgi:hypothetical protein
MLKPHGEVKEGFVALGKVMRKYLKLGLTDEISLVEY